MTAVDTMTDLPYAFEDFGMTAEQLADKFQTTGEHEHFTRTAYTTAHSGEGQTCDMANYWHWVVSEIAKDDEATPSNEPEGDTVTMQNVDLFAAHLTAWHNRKVAVLEHLLGIPAGTEFTVAIGDGGEKTVILEGDVLTAFRGGIATALMEMGSLPFVAIPKEDITEVEKAMAAAPAPASSAANDG